MATKAYIGLSSSSRNIKGIYIGVSGLAKKVKRAYIGISNSARLWWKAPLSDKIYLAPSGDLRLPYVDIRTLITNNNDYVIGPPTVDTFGINGKMSLGTLDKNFVQGLRTYTDIHLSGTTGIASTGTYTIGLCVNYSNTTVYDSQNLYALNNSFVKVYSSGSTRYVQPGPICLTLPDYGIAAFTAGADETISETVIVNNNLVVQSYEDVGPIFPAYSSACKCGKYLLFISTSSAIGTFDVTTATTGNIRSIGTGYWGPDNPTYDSNNTTVIPWSNASSSGINYVNTSLVMGSISSLPSSAELNYPNTRVPWAHWSEARIGSERLYLYPSTPYASYNGFKINKNLVIDEIVAGVPSQTQNNSLYHANDGVASFANSWIMHMYQNIYKTKYFYGWSVVN